MTELVL